MKIAKAYKAVFSKKFRLLVKSSMPGIHEVVRSRVAVDRFETARWPFHATLIALNASDQGTEDFIEDLTKEIFTTSSVASEAHYWWNIQIFCLSHDWDGLDRYLDVISANAASKHISLTGLAISKYHRNQVGESFQALLELILNICKETPKDATSEFFFDNQTLQDLASNQISHFQQYVEFDKVAFCDWVVDFTEKTELSLNEIEALALLVQFLPTGDICLDWLEQVQTKYSSTLISYVRVLQLEKSGDLDHAMEQILIIVKSNSNYRAVTLKALLLSNKYMSDDVYSFAVDLGMKWMANFGFDGAVFNAICFMAPLLVDHEKLYHELHAILVRERAEFEYFAKISNSLIEAGIPNIALQVQLSCMRFHGNLAEATYNMAGVLCYMDQTEAALKLLNSMPLERTKDSTAVIGHIFSWNNQIQLGRVNLVKCLKRDKNHISAIADMALLAELTQEYTLCLSLMEEASKIFVKIGNRNLLRVSGLHIMTRNRLRRRMIFVAQLARDKNLALSLQREYEELTKIQLPYDFIEWKGEDLSGKSVVALSELGVGDEIRYFAVLDKYVSKCKTVMISCDPRLHSILSRSFPNYEFVPVQRQFSGFISKRSDKRELAVSKRMFKICCDELVEKGENADIWFRTINMFERDAIIYDDQPQSPKMPIFKAKENTQEKYQAIIAKHAKNRKVIGISWRGGRKTYSRSPHYYEIEQWDPILDSEDYCFINLQYDVSDPEIAYLKSKLGDRYIEIEELDLRDDFESVLAVLNCVDYVVAICTAVLELAGAAGVASLYLMRFPQATHAIRLHGTQDAYSSYQDSVWQTCRIIPGFNMEDEILVDRASAFLANELS